MVFQQRGSRQLEFAAINKMRTLVAQEEFERTPDSASVRRGVGVWRSGWERWGSPPSADRVRQSRAWSTAVDYQMWHAICCSWYRFSFQCERTFPFLIASFVAGIVLFSGSIYLLVLTKNSLWGPITPLGGICILLGWF